MPAARHRPAIACALLLCLGAARADAQRSACTAAIAPEAMRRVLVSLAADPIDSAAHRADQTVQLFAQSTAEQLRRLLGASPERVPDAAARLTWRHVDDGVRIVLRRTGAIELRSQRANGGLPDDTTGFALLTRASRLAADSSGPYFWDERVPGDSLTFDLDLVHPMVSDDGTVTPIVAQVAHPAFTLSVPTMSPVRPLALRAPRYPMSAKAGNAIGTVVMTFLIDSAGGVDPTRIRDEWPADRPRPRGELAQHYRAFVDAVRSALIESRFEPARIGGCPVRELVRQPVTFELRREVRR